MLKMPHLLSSQSQSVHLPFHPSLCPSLHSSLHLSFHLFIHPGSIWFVW